MEGLMATTKLKWFIDTVYGVDKAGYTLSVHLFKYSHDVHPPLTVY